MLNNKASWKGGWEDKSNILLYYIINSIELLKMSSLKIDCVNTPKKLLYHRVRIKYYNVICEVVKAVGEYPKWLSASF